MGRADFEPGKTVERTLEDQVRERNGGVERKGDDVGELAVAGEPLVELRHPHRVDENETAELFRLGPDRMKFLVGELLAVDAGADRDAAQPELPDALLELLDRKIRVLQR